MSSDDPTPATSSVVTEEGVTSEVGHGPAPEAPRRALVPYLVVAVLGLLAGLIVLVQLWAYRDELRTILTQTPV